VIETCGSLFKQRRDDHHAEFGGKGLKAIRGWAWNGFGEVEQASVFFAAEVLRAEKFLKAHDLGTARGGFADFFAGVVEIGLRVENTRILDQSDMEFRGIHSHYFSRADAAGWIAYSGS
jgi:hypothetical protein